MLYNPNWRDPNPLTLEKLATWLEGQDPETTYRFVDGDDCAIARYLKAVGAVKTCLYSHEIPKRIVRVVNDSRSNLTSTYGELLARCREALAKEAVA